MMRDLVWTVIAIWLIYRLVSIFRSNAASVRSDNQSPPEEPAAPGKAKNRLDTEGEYVDFEEIR